MGPGCPGTGGAGMWLRAGCNAPVAGAQGRGDGSFPSEIVLDGALGNQQGSGPGGLCGNAGKR